MQFRIDAHAGYRTASGSPRGDAARFRRSRKESGKARAGRERERLDEVLARYEAGLEQGLSGAFRWCAIRPADAGKVYRLPKSTSGSSGENGEASRANYRSRTASAANSK